MINLSVYSPVDFNNLVISIVFIFVNKHFVFLSFLFICHRSSLVIARRGNAVRGITFILDCIAALAMTSMCHYPYRHCEEEYPATTSTPQSSNIINQQKIILPPPQAEDSNLPSAFIIEGPP